jgi:hypothetical protein
MRSLKIENDSQFCRPGGLDTARCEQREQKYTAQYLVHTLTRRGATLLP